MKKHVVEDGYGVYERSKGWKNKNLAFLVEFMSELGLTTTDIAEAIGYARLSVSRWLRIDDMSLKKVHEIAEAFGYEFILTYTVPRPSSHHVNLLIDRYAVNGDKSIAESKMSFLRFAMAQARVTISEVAKAVELHRMGVSRWFKIDDVNMHYIYIIAEAFGWEVNMHFKKKDKPAEPEKTEPLVEK